MPADNEADLAAAIRRFAQVAEEANQHDYPELIKELRKRWNPEHECDIDFRGEGYTSEGAFTACAYDAGFFNWFIPNYHEATDQLCQAEQMKQIQLQPTLEELIDHVPKPLSEPLPEDARKEGLENLRIDMQKQLDASDNVLSAPLELPEDLSEFYAITNGVRSGGLSSVTHILEPIWHMSRNSAGIMADAARMPYFIEICGPGELEYLKERALAAWQMGGDEQNREIYYVLCQSNDGINATWRILDRWYEHIDVREGILDLLRFEIERMNDRGEIFVPYGEYPVRETY